MLGQEVIKTVSQRGEPVCNIFLVNRSMEGKVGILIYFWLNFCVTAILPFSFSCFIPVYFWKEIFSKNCPCVILSL